MQDQKALLEGFFSVLNRLQLLALIIAAVQVLAAVLLISNTIRVAAFSRRRETGIMRLVGASNLYIQLPFLLEGVLAGLVGAAFASGALLALKEFLIDRQLRPTFDVHRLRRLGRRAGDPAGPVRSPARCWPVCPRSSRCVATCVSDQVRRRRACEPDRVRTRRTALRAAGALVARAAVAAGRRPRTRRSRPCRPAQHARAGPPRRGASARRSPTSRSRARRCARPPSR